MLFLHIFYVLFFVNTCGGAVNIILTPTDASFVTSGYYTTKSSTVVVSCTSCMVQFMVRFAANDTQRNTNFAIYDGNVLTINSSSYNSSAITVFRNGSITIVDRSIDPNYSLSFRRFDANESIFLNAKKFFAYVPSNGVVNTFSVNNTANSASIGVFTVHPKNWQTPNFAIWPTFQIKSGCEYYLYSGGYPSPAGDSTYLIHKFTVDNSLRYTVSLTPNYAATIFIPPNCPVSLSAMDYSSYTGPMSMTLNTNPRSGFVMSKNYPGILDITGYGNFTTDITYTFNSSVTGYSKTQFSTTIDTFNKGVGQPSFTLMFDNKTGLNFTGSTKGYSSTNKANTMKVQLLPQGSQNTAFLLHWETSIIKSSSTSIDFVFVSLFVISHLFK